RCVRVLRSGHTPMVWGPEPVMTRVAKASDFGERNFAKGCVDSMTADTLTNPLDGLDQAPTSHRRLLAWVREVAELTQPDRIHWCDGSDDEWTALTDALVETGTLV